MTWPLASLLDLRSLTAYCRYFASSCFLLDPAYSELFSRRLPRSKLYIIFLTGKTVMKWLKKCRPWPYTCELKVILQPNLSLLTEKVVDRVFCNSNCSLHGSSVRSCTLSPEKAGASSLSLVFFHLFVSSWLHHPLLYYTNLGLQLCWLKWYVVNHPHTPHVVPQLPACVRNFVSFLWSCWFPFCDRALESHMLGYQYFMSTYR